MPALQRYCVSIGAGSSFGILSGYGEPDWRAMVVFGYQQGRYLPDDNDQDGLDNDVDQCPNDPEDADGFQDDDGCPDLDNDDDQILDVNDKCPLEPEDMDGVADEDGCPDFDTDGDGIDDLFDKCPEEPEDFDEFKDDDGCPDPDTDKDGIDDLEDRCPTDPEDFDNFKDDDGCPERDNDGDGLVDELDKCPNDREDVDQIQDEDGCPEVDADEDGVLDQVDRCPLEAENVNGCEDNDGCPEAKKVCVGDKKIVIADKIFFASGRDRILAKSNDLLEEIATVLLNHPEIELVEIQGHTDSKGNARRNLKLSEKRAKSVLKYLVKLGVPSTQLDYKGYGEDKPIMENDTAEGRAKNRRVDFVILKQRQQ